MNYDEILSISPFLALQDNGGTNGRDDCEFRRILRTERFMVQLPKGILADRHEKVWVIERLFLDSYDNMHISWNADLADGSHIQPFENVPFHETDYGTRHEGGDDLVSIDCRTVKQAYFDQFRRKAEVQLYRAQLTATRNVKIERKIVEVEPPPPVDLRENGYTS